MTRLTTGFLIGLILGLAAPAAAQHFDPLASGRQILRQQQERFDLGIQRLQEQQQLHELQMLRLEIQRQGQEQERQRQRDSWHRFLNED